MDVARTSMIHAAAPHFLWPFAVQYAAHQINLQPRVSLPETTPTLRWTGKVGDASAFRVWGSRAFVRDTSADKLSSRAVPCVFLGFPLDAPGWQFYHPTSHRVLFSQDVTFDESVSYYRLFPYHTASLPPPPLFLAPGTPPIDPLPPQGPAPSGVSKVDPAEPVEVAVDSGAARGAVPAGAGTGGAGTKGAETGGAGTGGAEPEGAESGRAEPEGAEAGRVEPAGTASRGAEPARAEPGGGPGVPSRREPLSPQQLREWYSRRCRGAAGATGAAGGAAGAGSAGGAAGAAGGAAGAGAGAAGGAAGVAGGAAGAGAAEAAGGARAAGATGGADGTGDLGAKGIGYVSAVSRGAARPQLYYVPLLQQVLGSSPSPGPPPPFLSPPPVQSQSQLQPASPLPGPSPYSGPTRGLTECREPESRSASPVRTVRAVRVSRPRPPPVPGTHSMTLRPSTAPQRVPLPSPHASSLPAGPDPASDSLRAACPAVRRFQATAVTDPLFESTTASTLVTELVDFPAACRLDYATSLVAESASASVCPPSVGGECALGTDVLEDRQEEFECFAATVAHLVSMLLALEGDPDAPDILTPRSYAEVIEGPYSSQWQEAMDAEMASWKSTGTYDDEVPAPGANIVSGMWIFRVKRPPGSPPAFKAHYVARGFIYGLCQAPREWHDTLRTTLAALGFAPSAADPSLFLRNDATLPPFYVLVYVDDLVFATADIEALAHVKSELQKRHTCTDVAPPSDESVEPSGPYPELVGCLMYLMTCTRPDLAYPLSLLARYVAPGRHRKVHWDAAKRVLRYLCSSSGMGLVLGGRARVVLTGHADASWVDDLATQRSSQGYTFSLGSGCVSWRSTCSSFVLSSSCEAQIYAGAMAAQELR
ncbi:unnamed protein product [Closterium sp. NIES-54]